MCNSLLSIYIPTFPSCHFAPINYPYNHPELFVFWPRKIELWLCFPVAATIYRNGCELCAPYTHRTRQLVEINSGTSSITLEDKRSRSRSSSRRVSRQKERPNGDYKLATTFCVISSTSCTNKCNIFSSARHKGYCDQTTDRHCAKWLFHRLSLLPPPLLLLLLHCLPLSPSTTN